MPAGDFGQARRNAAGRTSRWSRNLGLGLERVGLVPLGFPLIATVVAVVLSIGAAFGLPRIKVDDSLSELFRSDTAEFRQYEELSRRFPSSEFDVLVVVEGKVLERASLERLRELVLELQLIDGTKGLLSMFSAREAPGRGRIPAALFPAELPEGDEYERLLERIRTNEIIRGKFLSEDGELALIVIALDQAAVEEKGLREVIGDIRKRVEEDLAGSGLTVRLSGAPVMQLEIRNAVERDRLIYNTLGFGLGCLIAVLFFQRVSFVIMAAVPPLVAILWSLGLLGWLDFRLNQFLNVMMPLIMVMGFSDSMQITYAARTRLLAGESKIDAMRHAVLVVGPAVVVTDVTAALSFGTLLFSDSHLVRTFGAAGVMSCVIAYCAVLALVPLLGLILLRGEAAEAARPKGADAAVDALRRFCGWIADRMVSRPGLYSLISLVVVGGLALVYADLEPRYRLADQLPDSRQAVEAAARLDAKLTGANPVHVLIEFPKDASLYAPGTLETVAEVHAAVEQQAGLGNVWSVETLRRWLAEKAGASDPATVKQYVELMPPHLTSRFIALNQDAVVVTGRIPDVDASQLLPAVERLDKALAEVRARHPGYTISVTGLSAIAARNSAEMIRQLSRGLTVEMAIVAGLIGIAFRSLSVMAVSVMPGLFPIVTAGAMLWWLDEGLQFASIVALTVAFGLGLDATIHYLNRLRLEDGPDEDPAACVKRATVLVGPALILTTLVLACGLAVTVFSELPSLRLFGWLSAFTLLAALAADLVILPATVMLLRKLTGRPLAPRPPD